MTDLSSLSNDELMGLYKQTDPSVPRGIRNNNPLNLEASVKWTGMKGSDGRFAVFDTMDQGLQAADRNLQTYADKHGLKTVAGIIGRWAPAGENDTRAYAQRVASGLGVDPHAPLNMADPNVRGQLIEQMAQVENGQPLAKAKSMADLSSLSNEELMALYQGSVPKAAPKPVPQRQAAAPIPQRAGGPTIAQDAVAGFIEPFQKFGHDVMSDYRRTKANAMAPAPSLMDAGKQALGNLTGGARMVGDVLGLTSAPVQAVVKPVARGINRLPMTPYKQDNAFSQPRAVKGEEAQQLVEGAINTALAGAQPARPRAAPVAAPKAMSLDEVRAQKAAAYQAVDQSGFRFDPNSSKAMAKDIMSTVADEGGKELYPKSAAMAKRIDAVVSRGDLNLTKLDKLRSQIGDVVQKDEPYMAGKLRAAIDGYIDSTDAPAIREARALHAKQMKMEAVQNAVDSADLTAASTYSGGNKNNAARQKLRPLIDPKSNQRIRNFTPDELKAANRAVRGTSTQNAVRAAGKMLDPRGLIGGIVQTTMGVGTHGLSAASIPLGMAATHAGDAMTAKNIQNLIELISKGGVNAPPRLPYVPPGRVSLLSPAGLLGAGEVAAPLARIPSAREKPKAGRKGR